MKKRITKHAGGLAPHKYLTKEQQVKLLAYCGAKERGTSHRAAMNCLLNEFILMSGLRNFEVCGVKIWHTPASSPEADDVIFVPCGKGRKERNVRIPRLLSVKIRAFVKNYRKGARPGSPLFDNERGGMLSTDCLRSKVRLVGKAAGIGRLYPHKLRHTFGCETWNSCGGDLFYLQDQMGHADSKTTAIYARTSDPKRVAHAEALGNVYLQNFHVNVSKQQTEVKNECNYCI